MWIYYQETGTLFLDDAVFAGRSDPPQEVNMAGDWVMTERANDGSIIIESGNKIARIYDTALAVVDSSWGPISFFETVLDDIWNTGVRELRVVNNIGEGE